jgi:hypothetical protein
MSTFVRMGMVAAAAASAMACASTTTHVQRLRELPVALVSDDGYTAWDGADVLIGRFDDLRTPEYDRTFPSASIPFVSLVHSGGQVEYPEHAGFLNGRTAGDRCGGSAGSRWSCRSCSRERSPARGRWPTTTLGRAR